MADYTTEAVQYRACWVCVGSRGEPVASWWQGLTIRPGSWEPGVGVAVGEHGAVAPELAPFVFSSRSAASLVYLLHSHWAPE